MTLFIPIFTAYIGHRYKGISCLILPQLTLLSPIPWYPLPRLSILPPGPNMKVRAPRDSAVDKKGQRGVFRSFGDPLPAAHERGDQDLRR